ncbi:M56 and MltD domain-containing protein [Acanthopleuribacter pedis]|uniref:Transglycosylase SLT domain-containing protein n=1 Tax=Acanthopleuribacter pedis TaxID=442870 RepID=A0A8J7Q5R2_9BACT|nr:M56 and MltD domain-containing protein [Acanthopleuribacter pedis]MBO1318496.1 transglycosylase SLT domain-containing protein [Acanthopleuribacter pedis]
MQTEWLHYLTAVHLLWIPAGALAWVYNRVALQQTRLLQPDALLRLLYAMVPVVLLLPLLMNRVEAQPPWMPSLLIWQDHAGLTQVGVAMAGQGEALHLASRVDDAATHPMPWLFWAADLLTLLPACLLLFGLLMLARDGWRLRALLRQSYRLHRIGRVEVALHDTLQVPLSFWLPGRGAYVLLPGPAVAEGADTMLMVRHELQHHRQGDTGPAWGVHLLRTLFFGNPLFALWHRQLLEVQEYACDAALLRRKRVAARAYGQCLLHVAAGSVQTRLPRPVLGMAMGFAANQLQRRIHLMSSHSSARPGWTAVLVLGALAFLSLSAYTAGDIVVDRRVSQSEVKKLVAATNRDSAFPIQANQAVVNQLNNYVGVAKNRQFLKRALTRMEQMLPEIEPVLKEQGLPEDLLVMPLLESGYQSLKPNKYAPHAAGLWQFIPATARAFDLRVDDTVDERLDVARSTQAATAFLNKLHTHYGDWALAVSAYNAGPKKIDQGISELNTNDAWLLAEEGYHGDAGYLAKLAALMIIVRHPELID